MVLEEGMMEVIVMEVGGLLTISNYYTARVISSVPLSSTFGKRDGIGHRTVQWRDGTSHTL